MKYLIYIALIFSALSLQGQNVGINTTNPQARLHVAGNFKFIPDTGVTPVRIVGVASTGLIKEFPIGDDFEIVKGELRVNHFEEDNIFLVGDVDQSENATLLNQYDDFDLGLNSANDNYAIIRVTGETNGYVVTGFADGYDGRMVYFYNAQNHNVTFYNLNSGSENKNQIITATGSNVNISNQGVAEFVYDGDLQKWILVNIRS